MASSPYFEGFSGGDDVVISPTGVVIVNKSSSLLWLWISLVIVLIVVLIFVVMMLMKNPVQKASDQIDTATADYNNKKITLEQLDEIGLEIRRNVILALVYANDKIADLLAAQAAKKTAGFTGSIDSVKSTDSSITDLQGQVSTMLNKYNGLMNVFGYQLSDPPYVMALDPTTQHVAPDLTGKPNVKFDGVPIGKVTVTPVTGVITPGVGIVTPAIPNVPVLTGPTTPPTQTPPTVVVPPIATPTPTPPRIAIDVLIPNTTGSSVALEFCALYVNGNPIQNSTTQSNVTVLSGTIDDSHGIGSMWANTSGVQNSNSYVSVFATSAPARIRFLLNASFTNPSMIQNIKIVTKNYSSYPNEAARFNNTIVRVVSVGTTETIYKEFNPITGNPPAVNVSYSFDVTSGRWTRSNDGAMA